MLRRGFAHRKRALIPCRFCLFVSLKGHHVRVFDLKQGITADMEYPSPRYGSAPSGQAAKQGSALKHWDEMLANFYSHMGWDENGVPLPETLDKYGLSQIKNDLSLIKK